MMKSIAQALNQMNPEDSCSAEQTEAMTERCCGSKIKIEQKILAFRALGKHLHNYHPLVK